MKKSLAEMLGDFLREAAVLFLVFGLLEKLVLGRLTLAWSIGCVMITFALMSFGMLLERRRRP